jgi:hypothetical protein
MEPKGDCLPDCVGLSAHAILPEEDRHFRLVDPACSHAIEDHTTTSGLLGEALVVV